MKLRVSNPKIEGTLKISSFIKIPLLLDLQEMEECLNYLKQKAPQCAFYNTFGVSAQNGGIFQQNEFIEAYRTYILALKENKVSELKNTYPFFSHALSATPDIFYEVSLEDNRRLIKAIKPPIQMQPHEFTFSKESETFYSMVFSESSVSFGIQFSYPNLFQDFHSHEVYDVDERFPNTYLFKELRLWIREHTVPTFFVVNGKRHNLPYRIGKQCQKWIATHPQLPLHGIEMYERISAS